MSYLTREDGEHFVIPSYRDVISKRKGQLKEDILQLSSKYGEYMTFQRRGMAQFEVAFSHDAGYLFGECVWYYFKRPTDLIYCEARPDTTEAYFVVVKNGGVYLDGTFPLENIIEEVLVFTTQKNNFEIYIHGEVPFSQEPATGKIAFDPSSVKSFTILDEPLFQRLPVVKAYQLQLVDVVLRQQGIGVFPVKYVIAVVVALGLGWMGFTYVNLHKKIVPIVLEPPPPNPYLDFNKALASEDPDGQLQMVVLTVELLRTLPGWVPTDLSYSGGKITVNVKSLGSKVEFLYDWAARNDATVILMPGGFSLTMTLTLPTKRNLPHKIYPLDRVIVSLIDRVSTLLPGKNVVKIGAFVNKKVYKTSEVKLDLTEASPGLVVMLAQQLRGLPLVLTKVNLSINHGLTGSIVLQALGN